MFISDPEKASEEENMVAITDSSAGVGYSNKNEGKNQSFNKAIHFFGE